MRTIKREGGKFVFALDWFLGKRAAPFWLEFVLYVIDEHVRRFWGWIEGKPLRAVKWLSTRLCLYT